MTVDYDPFSDEAMRDPTDLYRRMRAEGGPHYIEKYNAWALTRFDDVWKASITYEKALDYSHGQTPGQLLLGEPAPPTFMTMNVPVHRKWRELLRNDYSIEGVEAQLNRLRALVRETLEPLLERGEMDVYTDFAKRVLCINAGYNLGLPRDDAEKFRALIDDMLHRERGQVGMVSALNQAAAGQLFGYLTEYVAMARSNPAIAERHLRLFLEAEVEGRKLGDDEVAAYLFSLLVTGSETTPMTLAGTVYYLAKHPEQMRAVLSDRSLIKQAFLETARFDQPTNMLARRARQDFELSGRKIMAGQNLLFIYASANRDGEVFERPDEFDIFRKAQRNLVFGAGGHYCLGANLAVLIGMMMLQELFDAIEDSELIDEGCVRAYGEHLSGFLHVPIRFQRRASRISEPGERP